MIVKRSAVEWRAEVGGIRDLEDGLLQSVGAGFAGVDAVWAWRYR